MVHKLKLDSNYFMDVFHGWKNFEVRCNDRGYAADDILILQEYDMERKTYSGRSVVRRVVYLMKGGEYGVEEGCVVMAMQPVTRSIYYKL